MRRIPVALGLIATTLLLLPEPSPAAEVTSRGQALRRHAAAQSAVVRPAHKVGLGKTLSTKDGGQIFGFDIDQNGDDGVLASAQTETSGGAAHVSVETFDQDTGKITKSFDKYDGLRRQYAVDAIFAGDIALVTHYIQEKDSIYYRRVFDLMNPVTAQKFTGLWVSPIKDMLLWGAAENQTTPTAVLFAYAAPKHGGSLERPNLVVTNFSTNTSTVFPLDINLFGVADGPQVGQYSAANEAVFALTPDGGRVGGEAPVNVLVNLTTGAQKQFNGLNEGPYGSGDVNGLAVDPNTGMAATTTELNAQVEFYDLKKQAGIAVQLPCTGSASEYSSGSGIANDPINHLFLVTEYYYCDASQGSAILVYDEHAKLIETITGFAFGIGEPAPAINPSKRMGWALGGDGFTQLRQFFY